MPPLTPFEVVPVLKLISPLIPVIGALAMLLADLMSIEPLDEIALEPLVRRTLPPVAPVGVIVAPAVTMMSPPAPFDIVLTDSEVCEAAEMPPFAVSKPVKTVVPDTVRLAPSADGPGTVNEGVVIVADAIPPFAVNSPVAVVVPVKVVPPGTTSAPNVFMPGDMIPPLAVSKPVMVDVPDAVSEANDVGPSITVKEPGC